MKKGRTLVGIAALAVFISAAAGTSYANDTRGENPAKTNPVSKRPPFGPYMLGGFNGMRGYRQFSDSEGFVHQVGRVGKGTSLYSRGYLREPGLFSSAIRKQVDGNLPGAISDYLAVLELKDKEPAVHWYLGTACQSAGKMAEAKQEFEKERLMRKDALRMEREWRFDGQRGDFGLLDSTATAEQIVCDTKILNRPGCEVGDFGVATDVTRKPHSKQEIDESMQLAAEFMLKNKEYEKAITLLKKGILAEPNNVQRSAALRDAYLQYGDDLRTKHDIDGAAREYRMALRISKICEKARQRLK